MNTKGLDPSRVMHLYPELGSWDDVVGYKKALFSKLRMGRGGDHTVYQPHVGQEEVHYLPWSFHVADWGRRGGKTQGAAAEAVFELSQPHRQIWVVAPTYVLTDKVFRLVYKWVVEDEVFGPNSVKRALYNPTGQRMIQMAWGSILEGKSCESPKSLLGEGNHLVIFDEAAQIPTDELWETYLEPTLVDYKGRALFISTPRGYNWFWQLWKRGEYDTSELRRLGWYSSHMPSYGNPYLDRQWIEEKKQTADPATYRQEYEASFEVKKGLVYPDFKDVDFHSGGHLFDPEQIEISAYWTHYRAIDPGLSNPTAVVWGAVDPKGNVWVYDEYEVAGGLTKEHADNIRAKTRFDIVTTVIDPSAANRNAETGRSTLDIYRENGVYAVPADNDVAFGVQKVAEYLRATMDQSSTHPKLYISQRCQKLQATLKQYEWEENRSVSKALNDPDRPRKWNDHLPDALRYLLAMTPRHLPMNLRQQMNQNWEADPLPQNAERIWRPQV